MKLRGWLIVGALAAAGVLAWALLKLKDDPPDQKFARVIRETIHSSIPTSGKVEPIEWATARAERGGPVAKIMVQRGQPVAKDQALVEIDSSEARAALAAAKARIAAAYAELAIIERGGRLTDLSDIDTQMKKAQHDLEVAQQERDRTQRLVDKQAAPRMELVAAKQKVDEADIQIHALEEKRKALAASNAGDRASVQARLDDAEAAAKLAQLQIDQSLVRSPIEGTVYEFELKQGAYLNTGDTVAAIGKLDRVRVKVLVDEPDLGHVKMGMQVLVTWDALAGREWKCAIDKTPTEIKTLGSRQVGEAACVVDNLGRDLLPGTNVTAEIRSDTVENALTAPKEAIRTEHGQTGVYVLNGQQIAWKAVKTGVATVTRQQIEGIEEGAAIALFSEKPLHDGQLVKPAVSQ